MRIEKDFLGEVNIPSEAYWGIHTARAIENFKVSGYKIHPEFIKAFGLVKLASALTIKDLKVWDSSKSEPIMQACEELVSGKFNDEILVDALQGGAGTSLNMNVNEVIANRALEIAGKKKGEYSFIDPIEDVNMFQSTNDVYPTALKIACINLLRDLEKKNIILHDALQEKEKQFADIVKVGRTQLMDAVLVTLGKEFSAYSEAIARDRWRIYKCEERMRVVNIGGTAIGTGFCATRKFIFGVADKLRDLTGIGLARAENLVENTQNADVFVEVSGILKAHASNLIKLSNDLRLMASSPFNEISLPEMQAGSSIMAGKVNPVIPEMVSQVGFKVFGNDSVINNAASLGQLELNQNMPLIAFSILETLELLINSNILFTDKCIKGIKANEPSINKHLENSNALIMALLPKLGYKKTEEVSKNIKSSNLSIKEYVLSHNIVTKDEFEHLISSEAILALGHNKIFEK